MESVNPYAPPKTDGRAVAVGFPWWRVVASSVLMFIGVCFLLLLNGQAFSNGLSCLGFATGSTLLWVRRWRKDTLSLAMLLFHVAIIAALISFLPAMYGQQRDFNESMEQLRLKSRGAYRRI